MNTKRVIVALDCDNLKNTLKIAKKIKSEVYAFKIGYEFFFNFGINGYKQLSKISPKIFLDLKLHDIPNTVKKGIFAIKKLKPILTTIHISGGDEMMKASVLKKGTTKVLGVSILTSLDKSQCMKYYNNKNISILVKKMVKQARNIGLDGIVCSPKEIKLVRKEVGENFIIVTPGIRPVNRNIYKDDQKRVLTPSKAIKYGADLVVIGRPITEASNPLQTIKEINKTL